MRQKRESAPAPLHRLARFLLLYGLALFALLRVVPAVALFVQGLYDGIDVLARLALVSSLVVLATAWQVRHFRRQSRERRPTRSRRP